MAHAFAVQGAEKCCKKYFQVERKGSMVEVIFIKGDFYRNWQIVPTIYLRPTGDTRNKMMDALESSQFNQIVLIK